jgi:hypothetical protein
VPKTEAAEPGSVKWRCRTKTEQDGEWDAEALTPEQIRYAARDAHVLPELAEALLKKLKRAGLMEVYELERRVSYAVDQMERNGFGVDLDKLDDFIEANTEKAEQLKAELEKEWGINPGSSKQLREYFGLEKRADWPVTEGGAPKTDQEAMKALIDEDPSVEKWVEWKLVEKLRSTYGKSLQKKTQQGRIHAKFKQFGTLTGRFSSSDPNLPEHPPRPEDQQPVLVRLGRPGLDHGELRLTIMPRTSSSSRPSGSYQFWGLALLLHQPPASLALVPPPRPGALQLAMVIHLDTAYSAERASRV